ncbi:MAG: branched-chain amino acid aminotransferase [Kiritimatiellae bacterium]|nr:branched-chain amino acid aminotransferase [Kiritimatiellia bacterium]
MKEIDWKSLGFGFSETNGHIQYVWKDGAWDQGELVKEPYLKMHIGASCLHYGQECFEGMKVFACKDGKIRAFRPQANAARMRRTAVRTVMPPVPEEMFLDALKRVVNANRDYVPPYGTGGSMYIRPLLIGSGPQIGVAPAHEYTFIIMVMPVGNYYKGGIKPVRCVIYDNWDRAAPQGMGDVKVGGNYAASLFAHETAKKNGWPVELYLDAKTHQYVEEFSTSNFIGIKPDGTYVTPDSPSVLPSVTNDTLRTIAADLGQKVEVRKIPFEEIETFSEVAACGTAVVVTPVWEITRGDKIIKICEPDTVGPHLQRLHDTVQDIQYGRIPDTHGWCYEL